MTKLCDVKKLVPVQISRSFEDWQFRADVIRKKDPDKTRLRVWVEPGLENSQQVEETGLSASLSGGA